MNFRAAQRDDLTTVISWIPDAQSCVAWAGPKVRFPLEVEHLLQDLEFESTRCYAFNDGDQLLAFGQVRVLDEGTRGHLARIVVDPRVRGKGIGRSFVIKLIEEARRLNCRTVTLRVVKDNAIAISLYRKLGFIFPEKQPDILRDDVYYMQLAEPASDATDKA